MTENLVGRQPNVTRGASNLDGWREVANGRAVRRSDGSLSEREGTRGLGNLREILLDLRRRDGVVPVSLGTSWGCTKRKKRKHCEVIQQGRKKRKNVPRRVTCSSISSSEESVCVSVS